MTKNGIFVQLKCKNIRMQESYESRLSKRTFRVQFLVKIYNLIFLFRMQHSYVSLSKRSYLKVEFSYQK